MMANNIDRAINEHQGDALKPLQARARMDERATKLYLYLHLRRTTDAANARVQQKLGTVFERWSVAEADHLNFFDHELVAIDGHGIAHPVGLSAGEQMRRRKEIAAKMPNTFTARKSCAKSTAECVI